ncbi:interferon regulatory factor 1b isoform X3 [Alosa sapidissima]|uniref:interferon regulatory factor 1b isoform X3 n=1 Tax=Alosa sapidissima TaxID=34773 RepID=UPI001C09A878|nr:interferon regulatory factor 1b isoform X3 [Alosa sapidissima]
MPVSRMRMRPWLECKIESRSIDGLEWVDKDKMIFSIPWKHAARHGWCQDKDASLFKEWAIHTGKYKPGVTQADPKTWKANFRCAMNSLPDIEEVKDKSINKGCGAVRVYRMLPEVHKKKDKRSRSRDGKRKIKVKGEFRDMCDEEPPRASFSIRIIQDNSLTQDSIVDSTMQDIDGLEVPDTTDWVSAFQVSPDHSIGYDDDLNLIGISQQLERDQPQWYANDIDGRGFLSNELGTSTQTESYHSPQSQWSDSSEEIELQLVTELVSQHAMEEQPIYGEMWTYNVGNTMPQLVC